MAMDVKLDRRTQAATLLQSPALAAVKTLAKAAFGGLRQYSPSGQIRHFLKPSWKAVLELRCAMEAVTLADFGNSLSRIPPDGFESQTTIGTKILYESDDFDLVLFIFPPKGRIALHDHPGMIGIMKILSGFANISVYQSICQPKEELALSESPHCDQPSSNQSSEEVTKTKEDDKSPQPASKIGTDPPKNHRASGGSKGQSPATLEFVARNLSLYGKTDSLCSDEVTEVYQLFDGLLSTSEHKSKRKNKLESPECASWLFPSKDFPTTSVLLPQEANIHHLRHEGVETCFILDVLSPPYGIPSARKCRYYEVLKPTSKGVNDKGSTEIIRKVGVRRTKPSNWPTQF